MTTARTIWLKGDCVEKEAVAGGTITPGHLIKMQAAGTLVVHSGAGGDVLPRFALEADFVGKGKDHNYSSGDQVRYIVPHRGSEINALLAASAAAIVIGDRLESAGDGTLRKFTGQTQPAEDGLYKIGTLGASTVTGKFLTSTTAIYKIDGVQYSKVATDNLVFSAADTVNTGSASGAHYGIWLVQINEAGTISTKPGGGLADQVYTSSGAAIAALPAVTALNVALGYILITLGTSANFTANTSSLTTVGSYVDATEVAPTVGATVLQSSAVGEAMEAVDNSAGVTTARIRIEIN